jgi:hypothetical protein
VTLIISPKSVSADFYQHQELYDLKTYTDVFVVSECFFRPIAEDIRAPEHVSGCEGLPCIAKCDMPDTPVHKDDGQGADRYQQLHACSDHACSCECVWG